MAEPPLTFGDMVYIFGDCERVDAANRETAKDEHPSTQKYFLLQSAVICATTLAPYKSHPAYGRIEAYVNRHFGVLDGNALVRLRGVVCERRRCGTDEANRLTLDEVARALEEPPAPPNPPARKPGAPQQYDAREDERVADAWASQTYRKYDELAAELGWRTAKDEPDGERVKQAIDRHRKRTQG